MQLLMRWFKPTDTQLIEDLKDFIDDFETRTDRRMSGYERDQHIATGYAIVISELKELLSKYSHVEM
jgi:hypothetical protein